MIGLPDQLGRTALDLQFRIRAKVFNLPLNDFHRLVTCAIDAEFDRGRTRVERQDCAHACPRAACRAATAQEASRDFSSSARDVRITGHFAPSTIPAVSAWAR